MNRAKRKRTGFSKTAVTVLFILALVISLGSYIFDINSSNNVAEATSWYWADGSNSGSTILNYTVDGNIGSFVSGTAASRDYSYVEYFNDGNSGESGARIASAKTNPDVYIYWNITFSGDMYDAIERGAIDHIDFKIRSYSPATVDNRRWRIYADSSHSVQLGGQDRNTGTTSEITQNVTLSSADLAKGYKNTANKTYTFYAELDIWGSASWPFTNKADTYLHSCWVDIFRAETTAPTVRQNAAGGRDFTFSDATGIHSVFYRLNGGAEQQASISRSADKKTATWSAPKGGVYDFRVVDLVNNQGSGNFLVYPTYSGGDGSSSNPFILANRIDFEDLSATVNAGYLNGYSSKYFKIQPDGSNGQTAYASGGRTINMGASAFNPIGTADSAFKGSFNGNSCTVSSLTVTSGGKYTGLFGYLSGATVYDLNLSGVSVAGGDTSHGALAGAITGATRISNCKVLGGTVRGTHQVGGLVGFSDGSGNQITNCSNAATVISTSQYASQSNRTSAGGIVGYANGNVAVIGCSNSGNVYSTSGGALGVGGILGSVFTSGGASVKGCKNTGTVGSSAYRGVSGVGGIVGYAGVAVSISDNGGSATENSGSVYGGGHLGGIAGYLPAGSTLTGTFNNSGAVNGTGAFVGGIGGEIHAALTGGVFVNKAGGSVTSGSNSVGGCFGFTDNTLKNATNYASVTGSSAVGGVAGRAQGVIDGCANYGEVRSTGAHNPNEGGVNQNGAYAGGIVGYQIANPITNCYNSGRVWIGTESLGSQYSSSNYLGGIAGASSQNISYCYNKGRIAGSNYIGGISGWQAGGAISYCYNDGVIYEVWEDGASRGYISGSGTGSNTWQLSGSAFAGYTGGTKSTAAHSMTVQNGGSFVPTYNGASFTSTTWENIVNYDINGFRVTIKPAANYYMISTTDGGSSYLRPNSVTSDAGTGTSNSFNVYPCYLASISSNINVRTGVINSVNSVLTYDGNAHAPSSFSYISPTGVSVVNTCYTDSARTLNPTSSVTNAGTYYIKTDLITGSAVIGRRTDRTLVINRRAFTVTAENKTTVYGDAAPAFTYVYSNILAKDIGSFGIGFTTNYAVGNNVGSYYINLTHGSNPNYTEGTWVNGTLTVTQRPVSIKAEDKRTIYGDAAPAFTWTLSGGSLYSSDVLTTARSGNFSCAYTIGSDWGSYTVTPKADASATITRGNGGADMSGNYAVTFVNGNLSVNKRGITINLLDRSIVYGNPAPAFSAASFNPAVGGLGMYGSDAVTDIALSYSGYDMGSDCGTYTISSAADKVTIKDGGTVKTHNYSITFAQPFPVLTVTKRTVTIKADDKSITFGDAINNLNTPVKFSYSVTAGSIYAGDAGHPADSLAASDVTFGTINAAYGTYNAGKHVGIYTITPSKAQIKRNGVDKSYNYELSYQTGSLNVGRKNIADANILFGYSGSAFTGSKLPSSSNWAAARDKFFILGASGAFDSAIVYQDRENADFIGMQNHYSKKAFRLYFDKDTMHSELVFDTDFTVSDLSAFDITDPSTWGDPKNCSATLTGTDNYTGTVTRSYTLIISDFGRADSVNTWGTAENPYLITSWAHMVRLSQIVNGDSAPIDSIMLSGINPVDVTAVSRDYAGSYFKVGASVDAFGSQGFAPIGKDAANAFAANFDGGGYEGSAFVIRLNIEKSTDYVGLFGYVKNAVFRNVRLSGAAGVFNVDGGSQAGTKTATAKYVGALAGYAFNSSFEGRFETDCRVTGASYVGGLIGRLYLNLSNSTMSFSADNISSGASGGDAVRAYGSYSGGIFGDIYVNGNYTLTLNPVTDACVAYGFSSSAEVDNESGGSWLSGGIAGHARNVFFKLPLVSRATVITRSSGTVTIGAAAYTGSFTGGVIGITEGGAIDGAVYGGGYTLSTAGDYVGGIAGYNSAAINGASVSGNVGNNGSGDYARNYTGGIAGFNSGAAAASADATIKVTGLVVGNDYAGGIFGYNVGDITSMDAESLVFNGSVRGARYAGGIAGKTGDSEAGIYPRITVYLPIVGSDDGNTTVKGSSYVGGLFGYAISDGAKKTEAGAERLLRADELPDVNTLNIITLSGTSLSRNKISVDESVTSAANLAGYIGGIAGYLGGMLATTFIYAKDGGSGETQTYTNTSAPVSSKSYVGGAVGYLGYGGALAGKFANIANIKGYAYVGGVFGGAMSGAGLLLSGINTFAINAEFENTGSITASCTAGAYAGGISGASIDNSSAETEKKFTVYGGVFKNTGNVEAAGEYAGGIMGYLGGNSGITMAEGSFNGYGSGAQNNIKGRAHVGGLFGFLGANSGNELKNVYSTSKVTATDAQSRAGGLVGEMQGGSIRNSFVTVPDGLPADGSRLQPSTSLITGNSQTGGLVGYLESGTLISCYSQGFRYDGNVTADKGGVAGYAHPVKGIITNSWTLYVSTDPDYTSTSANGNGKYIIAPYSHHTQADGSVYDWTLSFMNFNECRQYAGMTATAAADYSATFAGLRGAEGQLSIGISLPDPEKVMQNGVMVSKPYQAAIYNASGSDLPSVNLFDAKSENNRVTYIRFDDSQQSFTVARFEIRFQNIDMSKVTSTDEWAIKYVSPANYSKLKANITSITGSGTYTVHGFIEFSNDWSAAPPLTAPFSLPFSSTFTQGTSGLPRTIASIGDWKVFVDDIYNGGNSENWLLLTDLDLTVQLTAAEKGRYMFAGDISEGEDSNIMPQHKFSGTFDGNGHYIKFAYSGNHPRISLFPNAGNAVFKNLTVKGNISVNGNNGYDIAGFVGKAFGSLTFENCTSDVDIHALRLAAGLTGYVTKYNVYATGCVNTGDITTTELLMDGDSGRYGTGGIIANVELDTIIESCLNTGNITGRTNVGGIVGRVSGATLTVRNSANVGTGDLKSGYIYSTESGDSGRWSNAGGIVGMVTRSANINAYACYNTGTVRGNRNMIGGIVGSVGEITGRITFTNWNEDVSHSGKSHIYYCYNTGEVIAGGFSPIDTPIFGYSGTIAGGIGGFLCDVDVSYCYNIAAITGYGGIGSTGNYHSRIGGIAGQVHVNSGTVTYTACYNVGQLNNMEKSDSANLNFSAGIIGYIDTTDQANKVVDTKCFSLKNQYYKNSPNPTFGDEGPVRKDEDGKRRRSGIILQSLTDFTAVYSDSAVNAGYSDKLAPVSKLSTSAGFGEGSAELLADPSLLEKGTASGWVYVYGCLPQLSIFAVDTKNKLSMLSVSYGRNTYGNFVGGLAGSDFSPYVIKDGIDLMGLTALVTASKGSGWQASGKYFEFADGTNNVDGDVCNYINMPSSRMDINNPSSSPQGAYVNNSSVAGGKYWAPDNANCYKFYDSGYKTGKSYHLFTQGAVMRDNPNASGDVYLEWMKKNSKFENGRWVGGATLEDFNFFPIGKNSGNKLIFSGNISGDLGGGRTAEIRNLNVNRSGDGYLYAGLFGTVRNAVIADLTVTGIVRAHQTNTSASNHVDAGGFAAYADKNTVLRNLHAGTATRALKVITESELSAGKTSAVSRTGGIVGRANVNSTVESLLIDNCESYADVTGFHNSTGGILGRADGSSGGVVRVNGSRTLGGIISSTGNSSYREDSNAWLGGICGARGSGVTLVLEGCSVGNSALTDTVADYNVAKVIIKGEAAVGGILSQANGNTTIADCKVYGDALILRTTNSSDTKGPRNHSSMGTAFGGILGYAEDGTCTISGDTAFYGVIDLHYGLDYLSSKPAKFTGAKTFTAYDGGSCLYGITVPTENIGGIIGFMGVGTAIRTPNAGQKIDVGGKIVTGGVLDGFYVSNVRNVGGVVGKIGQSEPDGVDTGCMLDGVYEISPVISASRADNVGAVIGYNEGTVSIVATASVTIGTAPAKGADALTAAGADAAATASSINANNYVGGFIGRNAEGRVINIGATSYAGASYQGGADGLVAAIYSDIDGNLNVGGFIGGNDGYFLAIKCRIENKGNVGANSRGGNEAHPVQYFGGVLGSNSLTGHTDFGVNSKFINSGVVGNSDVTGSYQNYVGGIIGRSQSSEFASKGTMSNTGAVYGNIVVGGAIGSLVYGTLNGDMSNAGAVTGVKVVGGMIGLVEKAGKISAGSSFVNTGAVTGLRPAGAAFGSTEGDMVGGVIGILYGSIEGTAGSEAVFLNKGAVSAHSYSGGVIGVLDGSVTYAKMTNSANTEFSGGDAIGGAIGYITSGWNTADSQATSVTHTLFEYKLFAADGTTPVNTRLAASGASSSKADPSVAATSSTDYIGGVGGVVGLIDASQIRSAAQWSDNAYYVAGSVAAAGAYGVGGVVGKIDGAYVTVNNMLVYSTSIANSAEALPAAAADAISANEVVINGKDYVGGIVGYNGSINYNSGAAASLVSCFNVGGAIVAGDGAQYYGGIVGGYSQSAAGSPETFACYWIRGFSNATLSNVSINNIETLNQKWTQVVSATDYAAGFENTPAYKEGWTTIVTLTDYVNGTGIPAGYDSWDAYLTQFAVDNPEISVVQFDEAGSAIAELGDYGYYRLTGWSDYFNNLYPDGAGGTTVVTNGYGDWGYYSEGENSYSTGNANTGFYFLYADDNDGKVGGKINVKHSGADTNDINAWKWIAQTSDKPSGGQTSSLVYGGGAVTPNHMYASVDIEDRDDFFKNGYYLYMMSSKAGFMSVKYHDVNPDDLLHNGTYYADAVAGSSADGAAGSAENVLIFYRRIVMGSTNLTYNGLERVAPINGGVSGAADTIQYAASKDAIPTDAKSVGRYFFVFDSADANVNSGTDIGNYDTKLSIYYVNYNTAADGEDSRFKVEKVGAVDSTLATDPGSAQYKWHINSRRLVVTSKGAGGTYTGLFNRYIEIVVDNVVNRDRANGMAFGFNPSAVPTEVTSMPAEGEEGKLYLMITGVSTNFSANEKYNAGAHSNDKTYTKFKYTYRMYYKNAKTYSLSLREKTEPAKRNNYTLQTRTQTLIIGKAPLTVNWSTVGIAPYIYNGGASNLGVTEARITGFVNEEGKNSLVSITRSIKNAKTENIPAWFTANPVTTATSVTYRFSTQNAATYSAVINLIGTGATNYTLANGSREWTIGQKILGLTVDGGGGTFLYSGQSHKVGSITFGDNAITEIDKNGNFAFGNDSFVVSGITYEADGTIGGATVTGADGICNVGKYKITISKEGMNLSDVKAKRIGVSNYDPSGNYKIDRSASEVHGDDTITINPVVIYFPEANWQSGAYVYGGSAKGPLPVRYTYTNSDDAAVDIAVDTAKLTASGVYAGDPGETLKFAVAYDTENAGTVKATVTLAAVTGRNSAGEVNKALGNYVVSTLPASNNTHSFERAKSQLQFTYNAAITKVYDGNREIDETKLNAYSFRSMNGGASGTGVTVKFIATYDDELAKSGKTVTFTGFNSLSDPTNYEMYRTPVSGAYNSGVITMRPLIVTVNTRDGAITKAYDGTADYASVTAAQSTTQRSRKFMAGRGLTVDGFVGGSVDVGQVILDAVFEEAASGRSSSATGGVDLNAYINGIIYSSGVYSAPTPASLAAYLKNLKITLRGERSANYYISLVKSNVGDAVLASQSAGTSAQKTLLIQDSDNTTGTSAASGRFNTQGKGIKITITRYSVTATYFNTSQSYANADNSYNTNWKKITGTLSLPGTLNELSNVLTLDPILNAWMWKDGIESHGPVEITKYTRIAGRADGANGLGATIKDLGGLGRELNLTLRNQPTLIIGYFVVNENRYEVGSLAGLMLATYYYGNNFKTLVDEEGNRIPGPIESIWNTVCTGSAFESNRIPSDLGNFSNWDEYFAAYVENFNRNNPDSGVTEVVYDAYRDEYGFYYDTEISLKAYYDFIQVANISGTMTRGDLKIITGELGQNWTKSGYLDNFLKAAEGEMITAINSLFKGVFSGSYDGNGYTLDGFNITAFVTGGGTANVGMFSSVASGTEESQLAFIDNLALRNFNITVYDYTGTGIVNVGGIVGLNQSSRIIKNSSFHGVIEIYAPSATVNAGGIVGANDNVIAGETVGENAETASVLGAVSMGTIRVTAGNANVGGIAGTLRRGTLKNIVAAMEIYVTDGTGYAGGIVGSSSSAAADVLFGTYAFMSDAVYTVEGGIFTARNGEIGNQASIGSGVDYTTLRAGSNSYYSGGAAAGKYDVVNFVQATAVAGDKKPSNQRISTRLNDIFDIYVLLFELKFDYAATDPEAERYSLGSSWLTGTSVGTDGDRIKVGNVQQAGLLRQFRFASFELTGDIMFYTHHSNTIYSGAFFGKIYNPSGYSINVRGAGGGPVRMFEFELYPIPVISDN